MNNRQNSYKHVFTLQSFKNIDDNLKSVQKKSHLMTETENLQKHLKMAD